jgi:hypothetical protein
MPGGVVFFRGMDKANIPFLDQIQKRNIRPKVTPGDFNHQTKVRFYQTLPDRFFTILYPLGHLQLLLKTQEREDSNLVKIEL